MRTALHDPQHGYYARHIREVGSARGDFTTVPMRDDGLLARAIARWAAAAMRATGCRDLVEIGPGEGRLMHDILRHLPLALRWRVRPRLVESSPVLAARQKNTLARRAISHAAMQQALAACGGRAVIFSNELIDAFPVRLYQREPDGWRELGVETDGRGRVARECLLDPAPTPDSSVFDLPLPVGCRVEVNDAAHHWLAAWLPQWRAGAMLVIDYGDTVESLYHRRPRGTVRGYFMHQRVEGPAIYENAGRQDLTADVNFTDLARWAAPWCQCGAPLPLREFLARHLKRPPDAAAPPDHPHGPGDAFRVLECSPLAESLLARRGERGFARLV